MNDRELLEAAALAAGLKHLEWVALKRGGTMIHVCRDDSGRREERWNPLTDDGDALRLAVKLGLLIDARYTDPMARKYNEVMYWRTPTRGERMPFSEDLDNMAATRRAIVRAAASLAAASSSGRSDG